MQSVTMGEAVSRIVTNDSGPLAFKKTLQLYHKLDHLTLLDDEPNPKGVTVPQ